MVCLQQNVQVVKHISKIHFLRYPLNNSGISENLCPFNIFFVTLLVSDWNIQILCLRKFLTENMKWILKKKNQQIHLQVNRNEMFWIFSFVACFKASGNLSKLVFLCPLFVHKPNRHRGWGLYSAGMRLPKAVERLGFQRMWLSANQLHHTKLFPLFSASDETYHMHLDLYGTATVMTL